MSIDKSTISLIEPMAASLSNIILEVRYGSDVYGTTTSTSDNDIRGIYVPSINAHLSLNDYNTYQKITGIYDTVLHPIKKYVRLAINSNPSCIEWLFVPDDKVLYINEAGNLLVENRNLFITKQVYNRYTGFARSELRRVKEITGRAGQKRKLLFDLYGYDPKAAMNVLRLLEQGAELLRTGFLSMPRPNKDLLIDIKTGKLPLERILEYINNAEKDIEAAYKESKLPDKADRDMVNSLLVSVITLNDKR